jgi:phosphoglucomutase
MSQLDITTVTTKAYDDQKPGTSGLRKKVTVFQQPNYLENFVQSVLDILPSASLQGSTLVVGGDGRYFCKDACQIIIKMAAANGVSKIWVGKDGLMSTPAVSAVVRNLQGVRTGKPYGAFILTASHNPGGPTEDFGIKYNCENGGPANEGLTDAVYRKTTSIASYKICRALPEVNLSKVGTVSFGTFSVDVIDSTDDYVACLKSVFNFDAIRALLRRPDFTVLYDGMCGVGGPYARRVLVDELGAREPSLSNANPLPDFGGHHPDPNLTYATELVHSLGLTREGTRLAGVDVSKLPSLGAATDGDADRNMILGNGFFVTPSDSLAIIAANAQTAIPFFSAGIKALARSMPTSAAVDRVAAAQNIRCFEVPTGWKFFGNLMDAKELGKADYTPLICGEESFGTGSNHVREKDGIWAICAWLSILAARNTNASAPLVTVEDIVQEHWRRYGRNYYCRYDYENVSSDAANAMMEHLRSLTGSNAPQITLRGQALKFADDFRYEDPVDGSVSAKQGLRFVFNDDSRFVFRLSGTGSSGATIRLYMESYEAARGDAEDKQRLNKETAAAVADIVKLALATSKLEEFTGRKEPTVIT